MLNIPVGHPFLITSLKTFKSARKEALTFNESAVTLTWSVVKFVWFYLNKQTLRIEFDIQKTVYRDIFLQ
jgi:hypothetical protein